MAVRPASEKGLAVVTGDALVEAWAAALGAIPASGPPHRLECCISKVTERAFLATP